MRSKAEKIAQFDPNGVGRKNRNFIGLPFTEEDADIVLLTVPWDVTASYGAGTAGAPKNILEASYQLDLYDPVRPDGWKRGIFFRPPSDDWLNRNGQMRPAARQYIDWLEGHSPVNEPEIKAVVDQINRATELLKDWVKGETAALLKAGKAVGLLGGEHSVSLGYLKALQDRHEQFGILQIDAHMDLREAYQGFTHSHASIAYNALQLEGVQKLVQVGIRDYCEAEMQLAEAHEDRVTVFYEEQLRHNLFHGLNWKQQCERIVDELPKKVYISFDIDGLDPALCPNTGTPVPGGLHYQEAIYLLNRLFESGRQVIGFDLCEVAGPPHNWDGNVGARILYKLCNLLDTEQSTI